MSKGQAIEEYYIVREEHKEEKGCLYHLHAWFKYSSKPNIINERYFDLDGYHPNIGKYKKSWIFNYLKKFDKNPLTNIPDGPAELALAGKVHEAIDSFRMMYPKEFIINYDKIIQNLHSMSAPQRDDKVYPLSGSTISNWDYKELSLLVIGKTGTGKTEWAKSYVVHHLKLKYFRVTHMDDLKAFNNEHIIIWDDMEFQHMPITSQIHIAEVKNRRSLHCRHRIARVPPGTGNIFLANGDPFVTTADVQENALRDGWTPAKTKSRLEQVKAIRRRIMNAPSIRFY